jgi:hypothetical protein
VLTAALTWRARALPVWLSIVAGALARSRA